MSTEERSNTIIEVGDFKVAVSVNADADGGLFVELSGVDCNLEGEQPGIYYPTPLVLRAASITTCARCGSDDLGHFDAHDLGDDSVTGVECHNCKWELVDPLPSDADN